ncbi:GGDEF domain-containing protein [Cellulomonas sp. C5510]|uniref:GGDEF domain-containing protein n=1 Tax=Cellulomonas sp. C5510 TaxID=2871170 RepID=UPI001C97D5D6|nr:GGDEF domain-containing protein [Cellulomonas sp. C5510]QZN85343.1 GGDEF domain-containing protein [Cellulomonas sp. C5510]
MTLQQEGGPGGSADDRPRYLAMVYGRTLAGVTGTVVVLAYVLFDRDAATLRTLVAVSVPQLALVLLSFRSRPRTWLVAAFPVGALAGLAGIGLTSEAGANALLGLVGLSFVYTGLFLPFGWSLGLVPLGWGTYLALLPVLGGPGVLRLLTYTAVWLSTAIALRFASRITLRQEQALRAAAETDALTHVGNRRALDAQLAAQTPGDCLVICDLDHFKLVNDRHGHVVGDQVLVAFARLLDEHVGRRGMVVRFGGEEFVLVLPQTHPSDAVRLVDRVREQWRASGSGTTFSAGVAVVHAGTPPATALASADIALYAAKRGGRDRTAVEPSSPGVPGRLRQGPSWESGEPAV